MELDALKGNIIGVITNSINEDDYNGKLVNEIVLQKASAALKLVGLSGDMLSRKYDSLSSREKSKVIIASKLHDKTIILSNITKGLVKKDIDELKRLFKKVEQYNRKIILIDKNSYLFLNCVDKIYVMENKNIVLETEDIFDERLDQYMDLPKIVEFINICASKGIKIDHFIELDELLKAIYRIKS